MQSSVAEHIAGLRRALENWPLTRLLEIRSERILSDDSAGFLRAQVAMVNGHLLEVAEYVVLEEEQLSVVSYKYHWQNAGGHPVKRWDNARHHPGLENFPHHVHDGTRRVQPVLKQPTLEQVLEWIAHASEQEEV